MHEMAKLQQRIKQNSYSYVPAIYHAIQKRCYQCSSVLYMTWLIGVPRILQASGSGDGSPPVGSRDKAPVGGLETKSPRSWRKMWN